MTLSQKCLLVVCLLTSTLYAQKRVRPDSLGQRVLAVVPLVGSGSYADPRRPLFAPIGIEGRQPGGISSYSFEASDDGKYAIVEFVARDRAALEKIITDGRVVKTFTKGKDKRQDIENELKQYKRDFRMGRGLGSDLSTLTPGGGR